MQKRLLSVLALLVGAAFMPAAVLPGRAADNPGCVSGTPSAPIKIEVFSDFQCPSCRAFYLGTMKQVFKEYGDTGKVCVIYREFPLQMHNHSRDAARYGHAALRLGNRQWMAVSDALFQAQDAWAQSGDVDSYAMKALAPADSAALRKQLADSTLNAAIESDVSLGMQRGVNATPTIFVTSKGKTEKIAAVVQYPIFKRYLDSLLGQ